jgi:AraC-like DNA-binding protein
MADSPLNPEVSRFLDRLADVSALWQLLDFLPEVYFFCKNARGRFMLMNSANLQLHGCQSLSQIWGKTDFDFHPKHLAQQYVDEDRRVMDLRRALPNQMWLVGDARGELRWFISSKAPLFDRRGRVIGIAGVMRDFRKTESLLKPYREMEQVLAHVIEHYARPVRIAELAKLCHLSISQFDRRFKQLFQMTPQQYVMRVRLNAASQALLQTRRPISQIALETGFYDQSSFTRQFMKHWGLPPGAYRRLYGLADEVAVPAAVQSESAAGRPLPSDGER